MPIFRDRGTLRLCRPDVIKASPGGRHMVGRKDAARRLRGLAVPGLVALLASGCSMFNPTAFRAGDASTRRPEAKAFRANVPMPPAVPRELDKATLPAYIVEPGDVLFVQPTNLDSPVRLPSDQTVLPDGRIDLGEYGRPAVA